MHLESHTIRRVQEMLGLSRNAIVRLVEMGFVKPRRGPRRAYLFSFQDVVLLRTAHELRAAQIPTAKILRSLRRLKDELPSEAPLTSLRIMAVGKDIAVRDRDAQWEAESGQLLMNFDGAPQAKAKAGAAEPRPIARGSRAAGRQQASAEELFARAEALEGVDPGAARHAYAQAIAASPDFTNAYLNLGALLCEKGECKEAVRVLAQGIEHRPEEPLLHFNRAVALEDLHRFPEALASYDRALQLDPDLADAHFNAGRLYDELGHRQRAIRHYSAYRRLSR
ncbi:tetratricopeptide repeat protein [Variovorax sp. J2P1-59]|uniref:tetratricopeptide repeat protein n=1 Tax=Variovorax flavidus TaxID=3053501 RepID=UPI0025765A6F|nr:tetratricopeptide repeat protein [Variovorax sp. J2P1-59]MDM0078495.1 tetratricopeptide repeat protein [Variovorax sp. J2P1-59]